MPSKGVSVIGQISGATQAMDRLGLETSLLDQTRLTRFILISFRFIWHAILVVIQLLMPNKPHDAGDQTAAHQGQLCGTQEERSRSSNTARSSTRPSRKKLKNRKLRICSRATTAGPIRTAKKPRSKNTSAKKPVVPKSAGVARPTENSTIPPQKSVSQSQSNRTREQSRMALPLSDRGRFAAVSKEKEQADAQSSLRSGSKGSLSLLDGFDPDKYASLDTQTDHPEDLDDDETVSLDTTETKYASYFARIKHQIERVWTYPIEAAQRGISGQITLRFRISKDGNLLGVWLVDKSGHEILDFAAIKAVKEAAPFYPFPLNIQKERLSILATFIYSPTYGLLNQ